MIIWSGWGIAVIGFAILGFAVGIPLAGLVAPAGTSMGIGTIVGGVLAAPGIWFFAKWLEGQPGRVLVDPQTGQSVQFRKSAGSLFFIPTRYWAFIVPIVYVAIGISALTRPVTGV